MRLFHGSNTPIEKISLDKCRPFKDFGKGFYLTEIEQQAQQMANRTSAIYGGEAHVTEFEFDYDAAMADKSINIKHFKEPDREWALFILANRDRKQITTLHNYDIVIGAVADDTIATLFRNFEDGIIDLDMVVAGLKYKKVSSQYLFHSEKSLKYLRKNG